MEQIYAAAGHPTKFRATPGFLVTVLAWFMPVMREFKEMNYQWTSDYDFRWDAYREAFGDDFVTHEDGVAKTLEWFKANPQK